jgi:alpha-N-arabinofuranosidase
VAQIVNIISWLQTRRDGLLKHTSFYPFKYISNLARGNSLDVLVKAPKYENKQFGTSSLLDVSASHDPATGKQAVFIINRSQTEAVTTDVIWQDGAPSQVGEAWQLSGTDTKQENTWENPNALVPKKVARLKLDDGAVRLRLPPLSFTALSLQ